MSLYFPSRPQNHPGSDGFRPISELSDGPSQVVNALFRDFPNTATVFQSDVAVPVSAPATPSSMSGCSILIGIAVIILILMVVKYMMSIDGSKDVPSGACTRSMIATSSKVTVRNITNSDKTGQKKYGMLQSHEKENINKEIRELFTTPGIVVLFIYANWCGHCKNAMPHVQSFAKSWNSEKLTVAFLDGDMIDPQIMSELGCPVLHFPMFYVLRVEKDSRPSINLLEGMITADTINKFVTQFIASLNKNTEYTSSDGLDVF